MRFADINGITMHYSREGVPQGRPLVFVNSLGTDLRMWDDLIPFFGPHFDIVRYDKRGHGLTDCPEGPYSIGDHASDLKGLLKHLGVRDVILVGISVGGMIAQDYAATNPQGVRALVLCDTAAKIGSAEFWDQRIQALRQQGIEAVAGTILERWFAPAFSNLHPTAYRAYFNMLARSPLEGYIATCEAIRDADLRPLTEKIKAKTLVLCGEADQATPPSLVRELANSIDDGRFELIEEAAHLPPIEQPETMAGQIMRFFQENDYAK